MRLALFLLLSLGAIGAETRFTAAQLREDFALLRLAYETLHPGLYKYRDKAAIDAAFTQAEKALSRDQSLAEAYRAINELTASFQCGHSYPNFYNQSAAVARELFDRATCLPFHFRIIDDLLFVVRSTDPTVPAGSVVAAIDGRSVAEIIARLRPLVRADGASDGKRLRLLEISGANKYDYFDILYPLYFPVAPEGFTLGLVDAERRPRASATVRAVTRAAREQALVAAGAVRTQPPPANLRWLQPGIAVLELNSLVNWNSGFKFAEFFDRAAQEYAERDGRALILDIRALEGGSFDVALGLLGHFTRTELSFENEQNVWAYVSIDPRLEPLIDNKSWAGQHMRREPGKFERLPSGQYRERGATATETVRPHSRQFGGRVFLLTSPENSSAGFQLADAMIRHRLATLVGEPTGGNQRGITGGTYFFIVLPNSKIEVDVPLKGCDYDAVRGRPDRGIDPDILAAPTLADVFTGRDVVLEKVLALLAQ